MAVTLDATVGGASSNSYETVVEAQAYFDTRLPLIGWDNGAAAQDVLLMMGTRTLDAMAVAHKTFRLDKAGKSYLYVSRAWTGAPATSTQRLAWPRSGMLDRNGNVIASDVIPHELKEALAELAGQLGTKDTTLDSATLVGGITSVKAGSVAVTFREDLLAFVLPSAVLNLMPASWFTDEYIESTIIAEFDVVPLRCRLASW